MLGCTPFVLGMFLKTIFYSVAAYKHCFRGRKALLLPTLYMRGRHGEHTTRIQRLPRHNPTDAPPSVRAIVIALFGRFKTKQKKAYFLFFK